MEETHTNTHKPEYIPVSTGKFIYMYRLVYYVQTVKRYKETECLLFQKKKLGPGTERNSADTLSPTLVLLHPHSTVTGSWHTMDAH